MLREQKVLLFLLYAVSILSTLFIFVIHSWFVRVPRDLIIVQSSLLDEMSRKLPDCIIIGVKKGGASMLHDIIGLHPDVEIAKEELEFFNVNSSYEKGLEWYRSLMPATNDRQLSVEKSANYFNSKTAPKRIHEFNKNIKLILAVRDPTERAISEYMQSYGGNETFEELAFVNKTFATVNSQWLPLQVSQYAHHMERWLEHFPLAQILVVEFSDLEQEPNKQMQRVEKFLGLRTFFDQNNFYFDSAKDCLSWRRSWTMMISNGFCLDQSKSQMRPHQVDRKALVALRKYFAPSNLKFFSQTGLSNRWPIE